MKGAFDMKRMAIVAALAAAAISAAALDFESYGFTKAGEKDVDGKTISVLTDPSGGEIFLDAEVEPSEERANVLRSLVAEVRSWRNLKAAEIRAINSADRLMLIVIPSSLEVEGVALTEALPGGINLYYGKATEYDFKVKSGRFVVRVASLFTTEDELEAAALSAYKDPSAFIAARDPAYVQKHLDELAAKIEELETATFGSIESAASTADQTKTKAQEAIDAVKEELAAFKAEAAEYQAKNDGKTAILDQNWVKNGRFALLAALNGGKPVKPENEAKIIEIKKAQPSITKVDLAKALKAAGVKTTNSEISAVLIVEFGEY
jgi:hypothetical protein